MNPPTIQKILVLGSGSAGLIAALALKRKLPLLAVTIVRSPEIGIIGVGEGTTPNFPAMMFDFLGIQRKRFYALAEPTWKLGIRFLWGPRPHFDYTFGLQLDAQFTDMARATGYYCDDEFASCSLPGALMARDRVFTRQADGGPDIHPWHAFHIENYKLVTMLESAAREAGVAIIDAKVSSTERGPQGLAAVLLEDGRRLAADFFVDASGFRSELLGGALEEPFVSFDRSLFCDRAVVGGWERTDEPILPYTTAETMDAGWAWQIEHEHHINRGYVYASQAISDDAAAAEFQRKNPKVPAAPRVVKFRSGHYRRSWVENVVAVGNAAGFVEPLEATALMIVCSACQDLANYFLQLGPTPTPTMRDLYNRRMAVVWEDVRNFLALHYRLNTRLDTPFWRHCVADTELPGLGGLLEFFEENGPSGFGRYHIPSYGSDFGIEGYLVMLVGNRAPYRARYAAPAAERELWQRRCAAFAAQAGPALTVKQALDIVRHPGWRWNEETRPQAMAR